METKVQCNVSQCIHNLGGKNCSAQAVDISYNKSTDAQETICNTYQPQYEGADNVVLNANVNYSGLATTPVGSTDINPIAKCQVANCRYNNKDGYCNADSISISLNKTSECTTYNPE